MKAKSKFLLLSVLLLAMFAIFSLNVAAVTSAPGGTDTGVGDDLVPVTEPETASLYVTPGRTVSLTLPEGVGNYTYNEEVFVLKGFSTDEDGKTTLLFGCKSDIPMGTYDLLYLDGETAMGLSVYGMGDVNMDGDVSARDVVLMKQAIVGMTELSETQRLFADVYADGEEGIDSRDAVLVLQHLVGMDVVFSTPEMIEEVCSGATFEVVDGNLYVTYFDAPDVPINLGRVQGNDGVGIANLAIDEEGNLVVYYTNASETGVVLGKVVGADGLNGADGVGIANLAVDEEGNLVAY